MRLVALAAAIEAGTGLVLMIRPSALVWLLLGVEDLSAAGRALGRIAGFALLALGCACWPRPAADHDGTAALLALLIYNVPTTIYLTYLGMDGELVGPLLWPAVALHATFSILLVRARLLRLTT